MSVIAKPAGRLARVFAVVFVIGWTGGGTAFAQAAAAPSGFTAAQRAEIVAIVRAALRTDPTILRDAVASLQADEEGRQEAAARVAIGKAGPALSGQLGDPAAGNPHGDVTVVEFYDLRCPYCRRMLPTLSTLLAQDRQVRLVYKDIPILGPGSVLGAKAVLAAQLQGGYQALHDALMTGSPQIDDAAIESAARKAGLDWPRLRHDMSDPAIQSRIDANLALAHALGVEGTPVYVVGRKLLQGAVSLDTLQTAVDAARSGKG